MHIDHKYVYKSSGVPPTNYVWKVFKHMEIKRNVEVMYENFHGEEIYTSRCKQKEILGYVNSDTWHLRDKKSVKGTQSLNILTRTAFLLGVLLA